MYERLIKDVKKTLHKTLGRTHLTYEQLEAVVIDVEKNLNNRPLTYLDSNGGEERVLTPNGLMWGQNAHLIEGEEDEEETSALNKRLREAKNHAWKRWRHEYVHSLMETHRITRKTAKVPDNRRNCIDSHRREKSRRVEKGKGRTTYSRKRWCCPRIIVASQGTPH